MQYQVLPGVGAANWKQRLRFQEFNMESDLEEFHPVHARTSAGVSHANATTQR